MKPEPGTRGQKSRLRAGFFFEITKAPASKACIDRRLQRKLLLRKRSEFARLWAGAYLKRETAHMAMPRRHGDCTGVPCDAVNQGDDMRNIFLALTALLVFGAALAQYPATQPPYQTQQTKIADQSLDRPANAVSGAAPIDASMRCRDGSHGLGIDRSGTCPRHDGMAR